MRRIGFTLLVLGFLSMSLGGVPSAEATTITPGQVLYVNFDAIPNCSPSPECGPLNLIFFQFRGGVTFTPNAVATASLFIDGVLLGSTTGDLTWWQGTHPETYWEFAAPGFPVNFIFQDLDGRPARRHRLEPGAGVPSLCRPLW